MKKVYISPTLKIHPMAPRTSLLTVSGGVSDDNKLDNQGEEDMGNGAKQNNWGCEW